MFSPEGSGWTTATTVKTPKGVLAGGSHSEVGSRPCHQCSKSQEGAREPNKREDMGKTESGARPPFNRDASFLGMDGPERRFNVYFDGTLKHRLIHRSDAAISGAQGTFGWLAELVAKI